VYGIDMPTRSELVAYGRSTDEISAAIGADLVIFQRLDDLISSVRQFNPSITSFDCSVFTGEYVTGGVDETYLRYLETLRADGKGKTMNGNGVVSNGIHAEKVPPRRMNSIDDTVGLHNSWQVSVYVFLLHPPFTPIEQDENAGKHMTMVS
jgi:amidophosphoribosyltransferase